MIGPLRALKKRSSRIRRQKPVAACTLVSNNYLAYAQVLSESYRKHHPGAEVFVCVVDLPNAEIDYDELGFTVIFARDLPIANFENLAFRYDQLELNTAVKPFLLSHLRDHFGVDRVFYFDPDILICSRLRSLEKCLDRFRIVLTPHISSPLDDDFHPSELTLLRSGVYNLGFIGLRLDEGTQPMLEWWQKRLYHHGLNDPDRGLFVDQSWMALAPALWDGVHIARDPIYNVAYWNLSNRRVAVRGDRWFIDQNPLGFFHFSGIDFENLEIISKHQDRLSLERRPELRACFEHYRDLVLGAGHRRYRETAYGYGRYQDLETEIPAIARRTLQRVDPEGRRWHHPFRSRGPSSFHRWLTAPIAYEQGKLNRFALALWQERPDLRANFPMPKAEHLAAFVSWLRQAMTQGDIDEDFLAGVESSAQGNETSEALLAQTLISLASHGHTPELVEWLSTPEMKGDLSGLGAGANGNGHKPNPKRSKLGIRRRRSRDDQRRQQGGPGLPRLATLIHAGRRDLREAFPHVEGPGQGPFLEWLLTFGREELALSPELCESLVALEAPQSAKRRQAYGLARTAEGLRRLATFRRPKELVDWLNSPARPRAGTQPADLASGPLISTLAYLFHRTKRDLQQSFPDPLGADRERFARWWASEGAQRLRLAPWFVEPVAASLESGSSDTVAEARPSKGQKSPRAQTSQGKSQATHQGVNRGVNLAGYFDAGTGIGQMSRASASALEAAGLEIARLPLDRVMDGSSPADPRRLGRGAPYDITLLNANADQTPVALEALPLAATAAGFKIGYWYWELAHFPLSFADRFRLLDEVWAGSRFCQEAFRAISPIPIRWMPPYVPEPRPKFLSKEELGLDPDRFTFFFAFDVGSVPERKNPLAAIEAIRGLGRRCSKPVGLLLKISRDWLDPTLVDELRQAAEGLPVTFMTEQVDRGSVEGMAAACDAFLSLHRSEGLGLLPIESMMLGKPVIATHYGGVTDFLNESTGYPVRFKMTPLTRDYPPYPEGSIWADPDIDHAVDRMQEAVMDEQKRRQRAKQARRYVKELYGLDAAALRFWEALEEKALV